jgi:CBS domain containing-hemolysin-like protein
VMTPRPDVVVFARGAPIEESVRAALATKYSRFPVVDPATDRIEGFVHFKDLVEAMLAPGGATRVDEVLREPVVVEPDTPLDELRREFLERNVHLAAVTDDAGTFVGIVTLEDLLEQFVGNIRDEQDDDEVPRLVRLEGGAGVEVDARLTLDVLAREVGLEAPDVSPHIETVGGLVRVLQHGRVRRGTTVVAGAHRLTVVEVRDGRASRVRVEPRGPSPAPAPSTGAATGGA